MLRVPAPQFTGARSQSSLARRLTAVAREAATANVSAMEMSPQEIRKIMLRCQTCGSRHAMREWCSRCGDPNPFAWFKRLRAIGVMLVVGAAVFLAVLAYQRTHSVEWSEQQFGSDASRRIVFVRRAGF